MRAGMAELGALTLASLVLASLTWAENATDFCCHSKTVGDFESCKVLGVCIGGAYQDM